MTSSNLEYEAFGSLKVANLEFENLSDGLQCGTWRRCPSGAQKDLMILIH